jgi:hypothetical protein
MSRVCPPCDRPVNDGYLCHACTRTLKQTIEHAPMWADQLSFVLARLTRYTEPSGGRSAVRPLPINPAATEPARALDGALRAAAATIGAPDDVKVARLGLVAAWLAHHVDDLRKHPDAAVFERTISHAVERATTVCDRPPEQWYAGACPDCKQELYPSAADAMVTCTCGRTWSVDEKRAELLAQVREVVAPSPDIARALSSLGDRPVTEELMRKWRHRGLLEVKKLSRTPRVTNWYRVGDVLDLLARGGRRRKK